ncbi:uncharacterized protein [Elaeis guineensis]|uniref:uncharacterized protein isoform X2 n=1 Tax=Elaeis guineensis var. tenera TaxID=51953 RepID=UPI003C6CD029
MVQVVLEGFSQRKKRNQTGPGRTGPITMLRSTPVHLKEGALKSQPFDHGTDGRSRFLDCYRRLAERWSSRGRVGESSAMAALRGASSLLSNGRVLFGNLNPNHNANSRALLLLPSQFVSSRGIASKLFVGVAQKNLNQFYYCVKNCNQQVSFHLLQAFLSTQQRKPYLMLFHNMAK